MDAKEQARRELGTLLGRRREMTRMSQAQVDKELGHSESARRYNQIESGRASPKSLKHLNEILDLLSVPEGERRDYVSLWADTKVPGLAELLRGTEGTDISVSKSEARLVWRLRSRSNGNDKLAKLICAHLDRVLFMFDEDDASFSAQSISTLEARADLERGPRAFLGMLQAAADLPPTLRVYALEAAEHQARAFSALHRCRNVSTEGMIGAMTAAQQQIFGRPTRLPVPKRKHRERQVGNDDET